MKRSEAIKNLLMARTQRDLAELYNADMEVQVTVQQDGGDRMDGDYKGVKWQGYTDGFSVWKPFRIPINSNTEPVDSDSEMTYDLALHAKEIGMTGWDWRNRLSRWVVFDFDSIEGHKDKHTKKLTEDELNKIIKEVKNISWVTLRRSTGGKGLHLYVHLKPYPTNNHTEHAALARAILGQINSLISIDLSPKVDVIGGNFWVWRRDKPPEGLELLKQGELLTNIPLNWKDHIAVIKTKKPRALPPSYLKDANQDSAEQIFEELTGQKTKIPLDEEHHKLIHFLHDNGLYYSWDEDNHMLVTHTCHLKQAHEKLGLKGIFETSSPGTEPNMQNCFAFPKRRGAWSIRRFTLGVAESPTWTQDGQGWTVCFYNCIPDLKTASVACSGLEEVTGKYFFREAEMAKKAALYLGADLNIHNRFMSRDASLKQHKDGRLIARIKYEKHDLQDDMPGWKEDKGYWTKIFSIKHNPKDEPFAGNYDDLVRHLITETNEDYGWLLQTDREWRTEPRAHVKDFLKGMGLKDLEVNQILGSSIARPWRLVCRPFQPERLNDRDWNRNAPQLAFIPTPTDKLEYPTWLLILNHVGKGLDETIQQHPWCKANGIVSGADYLKCWIASLFKEPMEPLPYLFFYGPQNSGKSIFHEALSLLITKGLVRADFALTNQSGFNGELENSVIAVVEETDMRKQTVAYNRIKDWVTSRYLPIHRKQKTPYSVPNTTKWIQCSNAAQACPIFPGDSRITMIFVESIDSIIPKKQLIPQLEKEGPDFLAAILNLELPVSGDRLNLPVIETPEKKVAEEANLTYLELFLKEQCHYVTGRFLRMSEFWDKFQEWCDVDQLRSWSKIRIGRELPSQFPKGKSHKDNQTIIGNISWTPRDPDDPIQPRLVLIGQHLEYVIGDKK